MESIRHTIPLLRELARKIGAVPAASKVKDIVGIFNDDQSLLSLPVAGSDGFIGTISRKALFSRHLAKPFAMDLYGKRPVSELLDDIQIELDNNIDIIAALARLLAIDPALETDAFPVVQDRQCIGIVSVSELMMRISDCQASLLETLNLLGARIREEVSKAGQIQQDLLPQPEFRFNTVTISAGIINSTEVGGDFYDYFPLDDHRMLLLVGDVSGHGVQSGMVTSAAKASLHTLVAMGATAPAEILAGMNRAILATARQSLLMTCLIVLVDLKEGVLTLANAGHNYPYIYRTGREELEMLSDTSGFPLGFEADCCYREFSTGFQRLDRLVLYSDGIIECLDKAGNEYGYDRFEQTLRKNITSTPGEIRSFLTNSARQFEGSGSFADDVTLLIASL